ncbi:MAG TPA: mannose-6-phosphate isomerase, class I [Flavisolibacter sp.]|nr:mannose-6-phosphate isomerase, class I [Flavisolibacter sp.]
MIFSHSIAKLKGVVQHYSWGGFEFIPELLEKSNDDNKPWAEYWLGAHPNHSSVLQNTKELSLADVLETAAADVLGVQVAEKFSSLPYLLKVLDVRQMLSIQVHPSRQSAQKGYEEEERKGISIKAPNRNYKDRNHKPELMVALGEFWLLHGFKPEHELIATLSSTPELGFLGDVFRSSGYKGLYETVMLMEAGEVNTILAPLVERVVPLYETQQLPKSSPDFWAARAAINFCSPEKYDRGIFSIYLFNLLRLEQGEGVYQPQGMPHAYLEGQNIEIMANSDNVLRAGLTDKHIDVPELMKHVDFAPTFPRPIRPSGNKVHTVYASPAEEFELHRYQLQSGEEIALSTYTADILLVTEGSLRASDGTDWLEAAKGEALLAKAGTDLKIKANGRLSLFRATVPQG